MVTDEVAELIARINVEGGERFYLDVSSEVAFRADLDRHFGNAPIGYAEIWRDENGCHIGGHDPNYYRNFTSVCEVLTLFVMGKPLCIPEITPDYVPPPPLPLAQPLTIIFPTAQDRVAFLRGFQKTEYGSKGGGVNFFGYDFVLDGDTLRFIKK